MNRTGGALEPLRRLSALDGTATLAQPTTVQARAAAMVALKDLANPVQARAATGDD